MAMLPIVDEIAAEVPAASGITRDDTAARPAEYWPDMLYVWAGTDRRAVEGDGSVDDSRFTIEIAYTLSTQETPDDGRDRQVSEDLDEAADDIAGWVRDNRANELWHHLQVDQIDFDELKGLEYRGVRMTLSGMREVMS
jgi:hypothetical protein